MVVTLITAATIICTAIPLHFHIVSATIKAFITSLSIPPWQYAMSCIKLRSKCDGTREETRFRLSAKRTSPFKSAGASVQSTAGSRGVRISACNVGYTMFRGSVKGTGYPLHSPVSPSLPHPCVTVCHHFSTVLYLQLTVHKCLNIAWVKSTETS